MRLATVLPLGSAMTGHSGTALPGLIAERIDPSILAELAQDLDHVILVVGTNGKTTTSRLIVRILTTVTGSTPIANASGANLRQGVVSSLLLARRNGRSRSSRPPRSAVFEVDELAFPGVATALDPDVVVMTNLFRDQLDRYGETERIVTAWRSAIESLGRSASLVICADDPRLDDLVDGSRLRTLRFGYRGPTTESERYLRAGTSTSADPVACRVCESPLVFAWQTIGHLGKFACPAGHVQRSEADIEIDVLDGQGGDPLDALTTLRFSGPYGLGVTAVQLDGFPAAYDCGAAVAAALALGIAPADSIEALDGASPAFGRLEHVELDGRRLILMLVKNPASMTEALRSAVRHPPDAVLLAMNDNGADGRDVSWIWDVDFDELARTPVIGLTGTRADDLAVRLKYAGWGPDHSTPDLEADPERALTSTARRIRPGGTLFVLATYTALIGIRQVLQRRGVVSPIPQ